MEYKSLLNRKERPKKEGYVNWYATLFLFGVYWFFYFITPIEWKNVWTVLLAVTVSIGLTAAFEKMKVPVFLKWLIAVVLCMIVAITHFGTM